mgnify:CR=1 FL=1|jgi:hypothetical protein
MLEIVRSIRVRSVPSRNASALATEIMSLILFFFKLKRMEKIRQGMPKRFER